MHYSSPKFLVNNYDEFFWFDCKRFGTSEIISLFLNLCEGAVQNIFWSAVIEVTGRKSLKAEQLIGWIKFGKRRAYSDRENVFLTLISECLWYYFHICLFYLKLI